MPKIFLITFVLFVVSTGALVTPSALNIGEYEITIYGTDDGFRVVYLWLEKGSDGSLFEINVNGDIYHYEYAVYNIESIDEIKPTPAEMGFG